MPFFLTFYQNDDTIREKYVEVKNELGEKFERG